MSRLRDAPAHSWLILLGAVVIFTTTFLDYGTLKTTLRIAALGVYVLSAVMFVRWNGANKTSASSRSDAGAQAACLPRIRRSSR